MPHVDSDLVLSQFRQALSDCQRLYETSGRLCAEHHASLLSQSPNHFIELMEDLHKGLVVKVYISVAAADRKWSREERRLAEILFEHVWQRQLSGDALRDAMLHVSRQATELRWYSLIRPFTQIAPLRHRIGDLETVVMRLANLVARADGSITPAESRYLRTLQAELEQHLHPLALDTPGGHEDARQVGTQAVRKMKQDVSRMRRQCELRRQPRPQPSTDQAKAERENRLQDAMAQLDRLIGMQSVKQEVRSLANFLKVQQHRAKIGLPQTGLSLHMVFTGNPGTGKTTVARIVGQLFGAMGILDKGHLVETDRSGLVAEYAGQTGPKTNHKIDEALDGVLFVDEAYSLVADQAEDPYGREAVQTLLKRIEDDRKRLVVILAGYPQPMDRLLHSNPGLSSRFQRKIAFEDYGEVQLCRIFELMCKANQYQLPPLSRARLLWGFQWLYEHRDEHFGNGRLARNVFEDAIRRLANRVAAAPDLTHKLLSVLLPEDIQLEVPDKVWRRSQEADARFQFQCPTCEVRSEVPVMYLGRRLKCGKCHDRFVADWGVPV